MPLYEYQCYRCGIKFDQLKLIAERGDAPCPQCGQPSERIITSMPHHKPGKTLIHLTGWRRSIWPGGTSG